MKYFGAHVSAAGGPENAPLNAHKIGATASPFLPKPASVERTAPDAGPDRGFRRELPGRGLRAPEHPAARQLPDQPGTSRARRAREVPDGLHRRNEPLPGLGLDRLNSIRAAT